MNLKILRAINQAQIRTLAEQGDSDTLFRAQVVEKILADDLCLQKMQFEDLVSVLVAIGYNAESAREEAKNLQTAE